MATLLVCGRYTHREKRLDTCVATLPPATAQVVMKETPDCDAAFRFVAGR